MGKIVNLIKAFFGQKDDNQPFINRLIKVLIASDFLIFSAFALAAPIFAVFITKEINGAVLVTVGLAETILLVTKSILQVPIARYVDAHPGEVDDFYFMLGGTFIIALIPFFYIFISEIWQLFLVRFLHGIGAAFVYPTWMAFFSRHLDKGREGLEWGIYNTVVGLAAAVMATVGGVLADQIGFRLLFLIIGVISVAGGLVLIGAYDSIRYHKHE